MMTTISERIRPGERVLCAVSGGADSMYLLARMLEESKARGFAVLCAHYHHGQRGAEADRDAAFVRDWCDQNGVPCFVGRYDGERHDEAALRRARYAFLSRRRFTCLTLSANAASRASITHITTVAVLEI